MEHMAWLSGENIDLAYAELVAVLRTYDAGSVVEEQVGRLVRFRAAEVPFDRLAFTKEVIRFRQSVPLDELGSLDMAIEGSFAVRCKAVDRNEYDYDGLAARIGEVLSGPGNVVELDEPDTVVRVFITEDVAYIGEQDMVFDAKGFEKRRSHLRPFSHPVSLHPKLARVLVNLAKVREGGSICDPFCGTGGILLEAGLIGIDGIGLDIDQAMIDGCRENLDAFDIDAELVQGDIRDLPELVSSEVDAVVSDLPYGRSSRKEGGHEELVRAFLDGARQITDGRIVFMLDQPSILGHDALFELYVHRSLSRFIYVL